MKFDFSYGGGVTGLHYHLNGDSNNLEPVHKELLEKIVNFDVGSLKKGNPLAKDQFKYKLNIQKDGKEFTLQFSDDNIPKEFAPLLSHLRQKATLV